MPNRPLTKTIRETMRGTRRYETKPYRRQGVRAVVRAMRELGHRTTSDGPRAGDTG